MAETTTLGQNVSIPVGSQATFNFVMRIGRVSSPYTDLLNVNPYLDTLKSNGGPTQTMGLLPGSPAIGAIPIRNSQSSLAKMARNVTSPAPCHRRHEKPSPPR